MKRKINNYVKYFSIILGVLVLVLFVGCSVVTPTDPIIYTFSAVPATITAGDYIFELTVREDTYDGTLIYTSQTEINLTDDIDDKQFVTFDFPSNSIEENSTVTFSLTQISGSGSCLYAVNGQYGGVTGYDILVTQTNDTSPPLDSFRRNGIAIRVYGHE